MTPLPFNGPLFIHDFVRALDRAEKSSRRSRPHYDERRWFRCLEEADQHDLGRAWCAKCDARDAAQYRTVHVRYYEHLVGDSIARMNGRPLKLVACESEFRSLSVIRSAEA
jgi:hypothetical protein